MQEIPDRQEMFNRAVRGLRKQGWRRSRGRDSVDPECVYLSEDGKRCAWGHVDPEGTKNANLLGGFNALRYEKVGLAAQIPDNDVTFAEDLQKAHDGCREDGDKLEVNFRLFARNYGLTWPE